jgi:hypothetical protein
MITRLFCNPNKFFIFENTFHSFPYSRILYVITVHVQIISFFTNLCPCLMSFFACLVTRLYLSLHFLYLQLSCGYIGIIRLFEIIYFIDLVGVIKIYFFDNIEYTCNSQKIKTGNRCMGFQVAANTYRNSVT